jgi:hypothetical protein
VVNKSNIQSKPPSIVTHYHYHTTLFRELRVWMTRVGVTTTKTMRHDDSGGTRLCSCVFYYMHRIDRPPTGTLACVWATTHAVNARPIVFGVTSKRPFVYEMNCKWVPYWFSPMYHSEGFKAKHFPRLIARILYKIFIANFIFLQYLQEVFVSWPVM